MSSPARYSFGPFVLDAAERTLTREGRPVRLTPKDVGVLVALVERHGTLVGRERLFAEVWPGVIVEDCNLARHVATLRQALGDEADAPTYIETIPRRGYRFLAPVALAAPVEGRPARDRDAAPTAPATDPPREPPPEAPSPAPSAGGGPEIPGAEAAPSVHPAPERPSRRTRRAAQAAVVLAGAAAVYLVAARPAGDRALASGPIRSLAVMPLENLTGDPRHDHLAAEIGEMLVNDLGRVRELQVVSRGETRRYGGSALSSRAIGRELGVDGLLEATVVQLDERLRITAELVDTRTERLVWAEVFEGAADDTLELQDMMAGAVLEALGLGGTPTSSPRGPHRPGEAGQVSSVGAQ